MRLALALGLLLALAPAAGAQTGPRVLLGWDPVPGASGYILQRCLVPSGQTACDPSADLAGSQTSQTTYTDTSLSGAGCYTVEAYNAQARSTPSNRVCAGVGAPPATSPTALGLVVLLPSAGMVGQGDSQWAGTPAALALDGKPSTFWHTLYDVALVPGYPHSYTLTLPAEATWWVRGLRYTPRQDGGINGTVVQYRVEGSADGVAWTVLTSGTWAGDPTPKVVTWPVVLLRAVRLVGLKEQRGGPWMSAAEVEIIQGQQP